MRIALVGFPYCGKTTLFSAISGLGRDHLRPGEETLAAVKVPDPRLDFLEALYNPKKRTEATIEFVDLPAGGDAEERAGLERHLPALRQADALLIVLRGFASDAVPLHRGRIDPRDDLNQVRQEMLLADLVICSNRVERLEGALKKPSRERDQLKAELDLLVACRAALENEQPLSTVLQRPEDEKMVRSFGFLTQKPSVAVVNVGEADAGKPTPFNDEHAQTFAACATVEADIMQLEPAERPAFLAEYGISEPVRDRIIRACYAALGMISFLTCGEDEVRAWPIPRGATAVEAAGKIHTDLARGFIRAETVAFEDLKAAGTMREAKAANKVRQEPKHYVVQDGDIINIKHSG